MDRNDKKKKGIENVFEALAFVPQMALSFVIPIFLGALAGNWLDNKMGTGVTFFILLILLGIAGGAFSTYRLFQVISRKKDN